MLRARTTSIAAPVLLLPLSQYKSHLPRVLLHLVACDSPQHCFREQHILCLCVVNAETPRSASGGFARGLSREVFPLLFLQTTPATAGESKSELTGRTTAAAKYNLSRFLVVSPKGLNLA